MCNGMCVYDMPAVARPSNTDLFSEHVCMVPFMGRIPTTRLSLASSFIKQSISWPYSSDSRRIKPLYVRTKPLVYTTTDAKHMMNNTSELIGGINMMCGLIESHYTFEDGMIVASSVARKTRFSIEKVLYLKASDACRLSVGDKLDVDTHQFWIYNRVGTVLNISATQNHDVVHVAVRWIEQLSDGWKFTTRGGHKGAITIVDDNDMPRVDGVMMQCCIGSKTNTSRKSVATLMEMNSVGLDSDCDPHIVLSSILSTKIAVVVLSYYDHMTFRSGNVQLLDPRNNTLSNVVKCSSGNNIVVRANYGMLRIMININDPTLRLNYTRKLPTQNTMTSRSEVSIGEMEFTQLIANSMTKCATELILRGGGLRIEVCTRCRVLLGCICVDGERGSVAYILVNRSLLKYAVSLFCTDNVFVRATIAD